MYIYYIYIYITYIYYIYICNIYICNIYNINILHMYIFYVLHIYIYILDIYIYILYIHTYIYIYIILHIIYIYIKFLPFKFSAAITPSDHAPCQSDRTRQTRLSQVHHILRGGTIQTNAESGHKLHLSQVWSIRTRLQILTQKHGCSNLLTWLVLSSYTPDTDKLWRQRKAFGMHFGKWKYAT